MLKKQWMTAFLCAGCVLAGSARAAQGDWLGRVRAIHISPDASSSALNLDVDSQTTGELDFS